MNRRSTKPKTPFSSSHSNRKSKYPNGPGGFYNLNGRTEQFYNLIVNSGSFRIGRGGSLTLTDPVWTGGNVTVDGTLNDSFLLVTGGNNRIIGDGGSGFGNGHLNITGSAVFSGNGTPTVKLSSDDVASGLLTLQGPFAFTGTGGRGSILNSVATDANGDDTAAFGSNLGRVDLAGGVRTFTINNPVNTATSGADFVITANVANGGLVKDGAGELVLTSHNITGGITVNNGLLTMGGNIGSTSSSFALNAGGGFSPGAIAVNGTGVGAVTDGFSGIGTANFTNTGAGSSVWAGGSKLVFQFKGVTNDSNNQTAAGTDWDLINNAAGALLITATAGAKINILIESFATLTGLGANVGLTAFSDTNDIDGNPGNGIQPQTYLWKFATNVSFTGTDNVTDRFSVDPSGVWNTGYGSYSQPTSSLGVGTFYVTQIGADLYIGYSSIPEPSSLLLAGLAAMGMGGYGWRRRRKNRSANPDLTPTDPPAVVEVVEPTDGPNPIA